LLRFRYLGWRLRHSWQQLPLQLFYRITKNASVRIDKLEW
jgi:hypothetical protein